MNRTLHRLTALILSMLTLLAFSVPVYAEGHTGGNKIGLMRSLFQKQDPVNSFMQLVKGGEYKKAIQIYLDEVDGNSYSEMECREQLVNYLDETWAGYLAETVSESKMESVLQTLEKMDLQLGLLWAEIQAIRWVFSDIALSKAYYQEGIRELEAHHYEYALAAFDRVIPEDTKNYADALEKFDQAAEYYLEEITQSIHTAIQNGEYDIAETLLISAEETIGYWHPELHILESELSDARFQAEMIQYAKNNDFIGMNGAYQKALNQGTSIPAEIASLYTELRSKYRTTIIENSISAYKDHGSDAALSIIQDGLTVLPEDEDLLRYEEKYRSCVTIKLKDKKTKMVFSESKKGFSINGQRWDDYGNEYSGSFLLRGCRGDENPYVVMSLDRKYSRFKAVCFSSSRNNFGSHDPRNFGRAELVIYADGVEVFHSRAVDRETEAFEFELNVTDVKLLKFEIHCLDEEYAQINIAEGELSKVLSDAELYDR